MRASSVGVLVGALITSSPPAAADESSPTPAKPKAEQAPTASAGRPRALAPAASGPAERAALGGSDQSRAEDTSPTLAEQSLLADVRRVVVAVEEAGWFIDAHEYDGIVQILLESACRTPGPARQAALEKLARHARVDPEKLYYEEGGMTERVEDALTAYRYWVALKRTLERTDECPFYVEPSYTFQGRQTEREKLVVHLEGGGVAEAIRMGDRYGVGGGGNGRLLLGWGFGDRVSLLAGGEVGGGAELNPPSEAEQFTLKYLAAAPVVARFHAINWLYDVEAAPVVMLEGDELALQWGARLGFAVGLSTLRARDFLPWAGIAVTVDHYFPGGDRPATQLIRGGLRVGIRWLP